MKHPLLMINMLHAFYWFDEALQVAIKKWGGTPVSRTQSLVVCVIANGEHRASRIARHLGISRQAINQVINALQGMGIVVTRRDPDDSRALLVEFSEQADPLREVAAQALWRLETELGRRIGTDKLEALRTALSAEWGAPPLE